MISNQDLFAFGRIARQSQYSFESAVFDLTGIGAIYSMGADWAHINRLERLERASETIPRANRMIQEYLSSSKASLLARVVYVASLGAICAGGAFSASRLLTSGCIGAAAFALFSMLRAGYNSNSGGNVEREIARFASSADVKEKRQ